MLDRNSAFEDIIGDTRPVCLVHENPNRLVSLWTIVTTFDCVRLFIAVERLIYTEQLLGGDKDLPEGLRVRLDEIRAMEGDYSAVVLEAVNEIEFLCDKAGFSDTLAIVKFVRNQLALSPSVPEMRAEIRQLERSLFLELSKRTYLQIDAQHARFIDNDELFGPEVNASFPSAAGDIREAGNCFAAECYTVAVFHLMRAAEVALRAMARDREVEYPHSSVNEQECGQLVIALDAKLNAMRGASKQLWPSEAIKNEQVRFYQLALAEFRGFNEAWRRHISHPRPDAFYDGNQAASVFTHVERMMRGLALRISEFSAPSGYWQARSPES